MTELYTLMRYLQAGLLKDVGIQHFDEWAADFGEVVTDLVFVATNSVRIRSYSGYTISLCIIVGVSIKKLFQILYIR